MMNEQVRRIMTTDPIVATPNQSIAELTDLMARNRMQQLPVAENGQFLGMVTTHDLWEHAKSNDMNQPARVADVMNKTVIKITPLDKVGTAAELFMDKRFKTLPVVNLKNELKGVVTAFDVLKTCLNDSYPRPILYKDVLEGTV